MKRWYLIHNNNIMGDFETEFEAQHKRDWLIERQGMMKISFNIQEYTPNAV